MKFKTIFTLSLFLFQFPLLAEKVSDEVHETDAIVEQTIDADKVAKLDTINDFWEKRETKEGQKIIHTYIESQPRVPMNFEIAWKMSRLVNFSVLYGLGSYAAKSDRENLLQYAFNAAGLAKQLEPNKVEGHYWYAVNLGAFGLEKGVTNVLKNAGQGRAALMQAIKINPKYHYAGAYRILGRYYKDLPSVISFGDKKVAEDYLKKANEIAPEYRLNKVYLGTLYLEMGQKKRAKEILLEAEKLPDIAGLEEELFSKRLLEAELKKIVH